MSLPMLCNLGLSGVAFVGADIGGFAGNATAELFARWMQVGMLYPLMRAHSSITSMQHEPWVFGEQVEQICRKYIELRYQLLPYLYTLFWQAAMTGAPILRPLLYDFSNDPQVSQLFDQVMLGPALMAAPVLRPGVEYRSVYLPEGTWYDWWTGKRLQGSSHMLAHAPLERMPLYVKAGSVIPLAPAMQHVNEVPIQQLRIKVWSGTGAWTLYEDDGESFGYQTDDWAMTTYRVTEDAGKTIVEVEARMGRWQPEPRTVIIEVVGKGEQELRDDGTAQKLFFGG
jgi:alpha-glucosidase